MSPVRSCAAASSRWAASGVVDENWMDQSSRKDWRAELKMNVPSLEGSMGRMRVLRDCRDCCADEDSMGAIVLVRCLSRGRGWKVVMSDRSSVSFFIFCLR